MNERRLSRTKATGLLMSAVAVGGLMVPGVAGAADETVAVSNNAFTPDAVTIRVGDTVTWTNTSGTHNVRVRSMDSPRRLRVLERDRGRD